MLLNAMDTTGHIFVRPAKGNQSVEDFAGHIFRWLRIPHFERRTAGGKDMWDEFYFTGCAVGIWVSVSDHHIAGLKKYSFLIGLCPEDSKQAADYLVEHARVLALRLSHEGFRCFVPKSFMTASTEEDGLVYDG